MGIFFHVYTLLYNIEEWQSCFLVIQKKVFLMLIDIQ